MRGKGERSEQELDQEQDRDRESAILVSLNDEHSLQELVDLAETAGVLVLELITQKKDSTDPRWYVGKGKVFEIKERLQALEGNVVIFDHELSGAQVRNLESILDAKIVDRTQLILDIFAQRAHTREGKIQVELAQLNYLLPRLSGQGKNLSRLGGGIGTRGPGETKLETDRRHIRNRISELKQDLKSVVKHRALHRERRKKSGVVQVALVGYTNAGKSTLLKQLTGADTYIENQLFATLDPTSRSLQLPNGKEVVITDTVGFIQHLPHDLIAAFRATLEEVCEADLILHVVDSTSEMRVEQMKVVDEVLIQLGARQTEQIIVYNKKDLHVHEMDHPVLTESSIHISAYDESDLEKLKQMIQQKLTGSIEQFRIPASLGDKIALIYRIGEVLEQEIDEEHVVFKVRTNRDDYERIGFGLEEFRGGWERGIIK